MKILFVCLFGRDRSATGAAMYRTIEGYETRFGGVHRMAHVPITPSMIAWADEIVCFESRHAKDITRFWPHTVPPKPILVLDIPNRYSHGAVDLRYRIVGALTRLRPEWTHPSVSSLPDAGD